MSISDYAELKLLETIKGTSFSVSAVYVRAHTGDPGEAGTANGSAETTRKAVTFATASAGAMASNAAVTWTNWSAGTETISHVSLWDASTAGNCLWSGALTSAKTVANGDTLNIASGSLTLTLD